MRTLDIIECAELLKINRITAYEMAARGELPGAKIGRSWVFLEDDLVEYLRTQVRQQQEERRRKNAPPAVEPKPDVSKIVPVACFSAIRRKPQGKRRPLPTLIDLPKP